jgi:class 3 adenylate cyclase/tetratricopeptide (TPR) repeat protein
MTCPTCSAANPPAARFCQQCGAAFGPACPRCGSATWPGARYCTECGTALTGAVSPRPAGLAGAAGVERGAERAAAGRPEEATAEALSVAGAALGPRGLPEERRLVTVLFADVVGFTPLSERLDPEDVRDLMLRTFRELARVVREHGGRIEKYIGDALFGLFGAPVAREDDVERALRCARALHAAVERLSEEMALPAEAPLRLRIGVNTGLAVVGAVGDGNEYGVMGDTVNTAARLQAAADPAMTLVGEATWRVAQRHFAFSPPRLLQLKGKAAPTLGYPLLGPRVGLAPARDAEPLLGRDAEAAALRDWIDAVASGHGRIGVITGETGIGKTRLLAEAQAHAERVGLTWAPGQGQPHRQHEPGGIFDQAARVLLGWPLHGPLGEPGAAASRLRGRLAELDAAAAYPYLALRLNLPRDPAFDAELAALSPTAIAARAAVAIERLFVGLASEAPLVLAVDDAHWADPSSLAIQERLIALTERVPLGLLYAFRADIDSVCGQLRDRAARELPHRYAEWTLGPLSREASAALAQQLLGDDVSPAVVELVLERAEGNPLYLEEVARSLVEAGALVRTESGWHLGTGSELYLPTTLHATLLARLDRLAEPTRHLLQAASVIGRQFALAVLERLAGDESDVAAGLLEAQRAGLLEAVMGGPERRYQFRHGLLQEVSYSTLLLRRRRELHRAAAEALLATAPTPDAVAVEALADQYAHAEAWPEAQAAATAAAERAEQAHAYREAVIHWQAAGRAAAARGSAVPAQARGRLAERAGDGLLHLGEWRDAQTAYETALAAWMEESPQARQVARSRLHVRLARIAYLLGDSDRVSALLEVAVPGLDPSNPLLAVALSLEAQAWILRGSYHSAAVNARRALELAVQYGGPAEQGEAYAALADPSLLGEIGPRARTYAAAWVRLARQQGDPPQLVRALLWRVGTYLMLHASATPAEEADAAEALAVATELRAPALVRLARSLVGGVQFFRGDWEGAARELAGGTGARPEDVGIAADFARFALGTLHTARGGLAIGRGWLEEGLERARYGHSSLWLEAGLARNLRLAGDAAGARAVLARGAAARADVQCPACSAVFFSMAAEEYAALGERAAAEQAAGEAQRLGGAHGNLPARLAAYRAVARLHLDAGQPAAALEELAPALRLSQRIAHPYERARTEHLAGVARLARGAPRDGAAARALLDRALRAFEHLGATPEADACRAALGTLPQAHGPRGLRPAPRVSLVQAV